MSSPVQMKYKTLSCYDHISKMLGACNEIQIYALPRYAFIVSHRMNNTKRHFVEDLFLLSCHPCYLLT